MSPPLSLGLHSSLFASTPLQAGCRFQVPLDINRRNKQWVHLWEDSDSKPPQENILKRISDHGNQTKALSPTCETITKTQKCSVRRLAGLRAAGSPVSCSWHCSWLRMGQSNWCHVTKIVFFQQTHLNLEFHLSNLPLGHNSKTI